MVNKVVFFLVVQSAFWHCQFKGSVLEICGEHQQQLYLQTEMCFSCLCRISACRIYNAAPPSPIRHNTILGLCVESSSCQRLEVGRLKYYLQSCPHFYKALPTFPLSFYQPRPFTCLKELRNGSACFGIELVASLRQIRTALTSRNDSKKLISVIYC